MQREAFTLRLDPDVLSEAKAAADRQGCSLNEFITQAVRRALIMADPDAAARHRADLRARIAAAAGGPLPPVAGVIRDLREGVGRNGGAESLPRQ